MCFRRSTHYQQTLCSEQWSLWKDPTNVPMAVVKMMGLRQSYPNMTLVYLKRYRHAGLEPHTLELALLISTCALLRDWQRPTQLHVVRRQAL